MQPRNEDSPVATQSGRGISPSWMTTWLPASFLVIALAAFAPGVAGHYFFSDSVLYIQENEALRAVPLSEIWGIWQTPLFRQELLPLRDLFYRVEMEAFGLQPVPYKIVNLILFGLCGLLAWAFARDFHRLFPTGGRTSSAAGIAAAVTLVLWIAHPSHVENVAWAAGQKDLLSGLFGLLALHTFLTGLPEPDGPRQPRIGSLALATVLFVAALMSKITVAPVAGMGLLLSVAAFSRSRLAWRALAQGVLAALPLLIAAIAAAWLHSTLAAAGNIPGADSATLGQRFERALRILGTMFQLGLAPYDLRLTWNVYEGGALGVIRLALALCAISAAVWGAWAFAFRRIPEGFGLAVALGATVPVLHLVPFDTWSLASERHLFWPTFGLALAAGSLVMRTGLRSARIVVLAVGVVATTYLFLTLQRSLEWLAGAEQLLIIENKAEPSWGVGAYLRIEEDLKARRLRAAMDVATRVDEKATRNMLQALIRADQAVSQAEQDRGSQRTIVEADRMMLAAEAAVRKLQERSIHPTDKWLLYKMHHSLTPLYERLIVLAPEQPAFKYNLALIKKNFVQGNAQAEAEDLFLRAIKSGRLPPSVAANAWDQIAIIRIFRKDMAGAHEALIFAMNADPAGYRAAYRLLALETREGGVEAAMAATRQFRRRALAAGMEPSVIADKIEEVGTLKHIMGNPIIE
jgi:hypothetical protein